MSLPRILAVALTLVFGGLSVAHSQSTQVYTSKHPMWGLLVGNCQLKVQSFGSGLVFIPVGNSSLQFGAALPDSKHLDQPLKIVQSAQRGGYTVTETLSVFFTMRGNEIVPVRYNLEREYSRKGFGNIEKYHANCMDLESEAI